MEKMVDSTQLALFFNYWSLVNTSDFFLYIAIGGRGIGKTYSILKGLVENNEKILYVRRTETELKNCCSDELNPFKSINEDLGRDIHMYPKADSFLIVENDEVIGLAGSLSTFGKFRGADFSDINYVFFDEFISTQPRDTLKKDEDFLFFNMLETVARNREILGKGKIKVILSANSNKLDSGILRELKLVDIAMMMKLEKQEVYTDDERGIYMTMPDDVPISRKKKETALYKLTRGTTFEQMALSNEFVNDDFSNIKKYKSSQLMPLVSYEKIFFYQVKGQELIYATYRKANCPSYDRKNKNEFMMSFYRYLKYFIDGNKMRFSCYNIRLEVLDI